MYLAAQLQRRVFRCQSCTQYPPSATSFRFCFHLDLVLRRLFSTPLSFSLFSSSPRTSLPTTSSSRYFSSVFATFYVGSFKPRQILGRYVCIRTSTKASSRNVFSFFFFFFVRKKRKIELHVFSPVNRIAAFPQKPSYARNLPQSREEANSTRHIRLDKANRYSLSPHLSTFLFRIPGRLFFFFRLSPRYSFVTNCRNLPKILITILAIVISSS